MLHYILHDNDIQMTASHVPGKLNVLADELSRDVIPNSLQDGTRVGVPEAYLMTWFEHSERRLDTRLL